jgi:hypothetical protein
VGVSSDRAVRLRELADLGCAVTVERELGTDDEICVVSIGERRVLGRGKNADDAVADALAQWDEAGS